VVTPTEITSYRPEYREAFERLNRVWLEGHSLLEPIDLTVLQNPEASVLARGGEIFFAIENGEVLGTCAAIRVSETTFELAKLAVTPAAQGRGLGRRLVGAVIDLARRKGVRELVLTSSTRLVAALHLYSSLGFRDAPMPADVPYVTADVFMTLDLDERLPPSPL
jgi:GNAT superfamily N-acetyltransferase